MTEQLQITPRAHMIDTYVDEYSRGWQNRLIVPQFESLTHQVDAVCVQIYQGGPWADFPAVWEPLARPCGIRGVYTYQVDDEPWEKQASGTLNALPYDSHFIALDIEKTGNILDKTFMQACGYILRYWQKNAPSQKIAYYLNPDVYVNYVLPIMLKYFPYDKWYLEFAMWTANWPFLTSMRSPNNNPYIPPLMRGDWSIYQYTDALNKPNYASLDGDVFNGPVSDMRKWLGLEPTPIPVPVPIPTPTPTPTPTPVGVLLEEKWFGGKALYQKCQMFTDRTVIYHVVRMNIADWDVYFDDHVNPRVTTEFLEHSGVQIAINGLDGWETQKYRRWFVTYLQGFAASKGKQIKGLNRESVLYISKAKEFSLFRPKEIWDACSFPNLLILDGKKWPITSEDTLARARTLLGIIKATGEMIVICIDGKDYWSHEGLTVEDAQQLGIDLGIDLLLQSDSGGSTTLVRVGDDGHTLIVNVPCGEEAEKQNQRIVAIHMGFRLLVGGVPVIPPTPVPPPPSLFPIRLPLRKKKEGEG